MFVPTGYKLIVDSTAILSVYTIFTFNIPQSTYSTVNMEFRNGNLSLRITQSVFIVLGLWRPNHLTGIKVHLYNFYSFVSLMSILGTYIIMQVGDLIQIWGNVPYMTGTMFLLFTNLALGTKALNAMWKKKVIQGMLKEANKELSSENRPMGRAIVKSCNDETTRQFFVYFALSLLTVFGWGASAEKHQLPLRAWYPYDTSATPAYQLTYAHQCIAILLAAIINICVDTLVTSLISQTRCRFKLLGLSLMTLCDGLEVADDGCLTSASDKIVSDRLRHCVHRHQAVLAQVSLLQHCFSASILAQFFVSMVIICVTAYQLAFEYTNMFRLLSMVTYLADMMLQVFIYCYQGNQLVEDSEGVSTAAYECPWYSCSIRVRRSLVLVMTRTRLASKLTASGFTELSLATFMSIIKASYSFFTVLQRVEEK